MKIVRTIAALNDVLLLSRKGHMSIGLVPTMGALHRGHAALVQQCVQNNDVCVVSIFVNPTQFNNKEDLRKYPRTLEQDCALLEETGADVVFAPSEEEMYPETDTRMFAFGALANVMEGKFRPGHFNGVAQIVSKLLHAVQPDTAYFGEKDFQQLAIIREMVKQLGLPVAIVAVPIVREESGLAMSSRNTLLSGEQRAEAAAIYRTLTASTSYAEGHTVLQTVDFVVQQINNVDGLNVEYFEIVDGVSLQPLSGWEESTDIVGCIAVFCAEVRLIDNIRYQ